MKRLACVALLMALGCEGDDDSTTEMGVQEVRGGAGVTATTSGDVVTVAADFNAVARAAHTHAFADLTDTPTNATAGAKCATGQHVTGIDVLTGKVACANDVMDTDTDTLAELSCEEGQVPKLTGGEWACGNDAVGGGSGGGGTVTSVTAGAGLLGGTITGAGTLAVDFSQVAMKDESWEVVGDGALRFDGAIGLGRDPVEAITVESVNAQLALRDKAGQNSAAVVLDDADGEGGILNVAFQRAGATLATIFLSGAPGNTLTFQTENTSHRWKINGATEAMRIDGATGFVGIGTNSPTARLEVSDGTGPNATCDGNTWINASSRTAKEGIKTFADDDYRRVRRWLDDTDVVWYRYRDDHDPRSRVGLIAEDVPDVLATPDRKGISTADAIGFLTAAAKDLSTENSRLRKENEALADRLSRLEERLGRVEADRR